MFRFRLEQWLFVASISLILYLCLYPRFLTHARLRWVYHVGLYQKPFRSFWSMQRGWITTWMENKASWVPNPFLKPNCVSLILLSSLLYIRVWMILRKAFRMWLIKLIILWSKHLVAFAFLGSGMNVDISQSFGIWQML